jgi:hypothetical protein
MSGYAEALRSIGQTLEARRITAFELKHSADMYVVQNATQSELPFRARMQTWFRGGHAAGVTEPLMLSFADVEKLSETGRANRSTPDRLTDFKRLPNLLRTIGAYLDSGRFELTALQLRAISLSLSYRDHEGNPQQEDRTVASFYRTFLDLCQKRSRH